MGVCRHDLKLNVCFVEPVYFGDKTFEIRYNADRGFQKGDLVQFEAVDNDGRQIKHPINNEWYEITYVLSGFGLQPDHVAFGIKKIVENTA